LCFILKSKISNVSSSLVSDRVVFSSFSEVHTYSAVVVVRLRVIVLRLYHWESHHVASRPLERSINSLPYLLASTRKVADDRHMGVVLELKLLLLPCDRNLILV